MIPRPGGWPAGRMAFPRRVFRTTVAGAILGGLYSALAGLVVLLRIGTGGGLWEATKLWMWAALAYVVGWSVAGAIVGILLPLSKTVPGRMLIGLFAIVPVYLSIAGMLVQIGLIPAGLDVVKVALAISLMSGPLFGVISWFAIGPNERFD